MGKKGKDKTKKDAVTGAPISTKAKSKCKWFFEQGFCKSGARCPFYHGTWKEVEEYKNGYFIDDNAIDVVPQPAMKKKVSKKPAGVTNMSKKITYDDYYDTLGADDYYDDYYDDYAQYEEQFFDKKSKHKQARVPKQQFEKLHAPAHPQAPAQKEEEKKEETQEEHKDGKNGKHEEEKAKKPSKIASKYIKDKIPEMKDFKEKFSGFNTDFYEETAKDNKEFFTNGFQSYIRDIKYKMTKGVISKSQGKFELEMANIRHKYADSFNIIKQDNTKNMVMFSLNLVPTCFKEELKIEIFDGHLELYVLHNTDSSKESKLPVFCIRNTSIPVEIRNAMEQIFWKTAHNLQKEKVFKTLKLIETYLPDITKSVADHLQETNLKIWDANETRKLKASIKFYNLIPKEPPSEARTEKIFKISNFILSRSYDECHKIMFEHEVDNIKEDITESTVKAGDAEEDDEDEEYDEYTFADEEAKKVVGNKNEVHAAKTAVKNSKKTLIELYGFESLGGAMIVLHSFTVSYQCTICLFSFDAKLTLLDSKERMLNCSNKCFRCKSKVVIICHYNYIHSENPIDAGTLVAVNAGNMNITIANFNVTCETCSYESLMEHVLPHEQCKFNCFACHRKIEFKYDQICFKETDGSISQAGGKFKNFLDKRMKKLGQEDDIIQTIKPGFPLPKNGSCRHNKKSCKWYRYPCCGKMYPCDTCHSMRVDHKKEAPLTIICGLCSKEQPVKHHICCSCNKSFNASKNKPNFWQGGKGDVNKETMSHKDTHKYKNSGLKTVSKKAQKNMS